MRNAYFNQGLEGPGPERRGRRGDPDERRRGEGRGRPEHGRHMHGPFGRPFPGEEEGFGPFAGRHGGPHGPGFGPGDLDFGFGPRGRGRGRGRAGRGDVRAAIISLLSEEPRNGYQIIQEINERTGGLWRVSSGSVYPAISQLEDEGLIEPTDGNGRKLFALTAAGREHAEQNADHLRQLWQIGEQGTRFGEFLHYRELIGQLVAATRQVNEVGTAAQREEAKQILVRARQSLYKILAADPADAAAEPTDEV
ncbi:PadR family transcriptional regulator [Actinospica robiniae]|uniref:PadR family transcriptional regulator n=1 Tax=Actinospica robiniae TaxID=304901 RepID=UPI0003FA9123|nr:PadR family transcriptional regulator [Actinospica robiniae]